MSKLEEWIEVTPAYDCIVNPCKWGKDWCDSGNTRNTHGRHGADVRWYARGPRGVVQFVIFSHWYLPESYASEPRLRAREGPDGCDLGHHGYAPAHGGETFVPHCDLLPGIAGCWYDGSGLRADDLLEVLVREGSDAVWERLRREYEEVFGGQLELTSTT